LLDVQGVQLTDFVYEDFYKAESGAFTFVQKNTLWGIVDNNGKEITACQYNNYTPVGNVFLVQKGDKFGFLDKKGKLMGGNCLYDFYDEYHVYRNIRIDGNLLVKSKKE
jgi:MoaA/NifB/PqqE/SkfB family radical SAM enzyme